MTSSTLGFIGMAHLLFLSDLSVENWYSDDVHLRCKVRENPPHQNQQLICHKTYYSSLGAEGVVGAAELHEVAK